MKPPTTSFPVVDAPTTRRHVRINGPESPIKLWVELDINGRTVQRVEGKSFVANFLALLLMQFAGHNDTRTVSPTNQFDRRAWHYGSALAESYVTGATNATPIVITHDGSYTFTDGQPVYIQGVGGNTAANGEYYADYLSPTTFALYTNEGLTTGVAGSGTYTSGGVIAFGETHEQGAHNSNFQFLGIFVGSSTDAVRIEDWCLHHKIRDGSGTGELSYGSHAYGTPNVGATSVTYRVERVLTNNSGGTVNVRELCMVTYDAPISSGEGLMINRDLVTQDVLDGEELTVKFDIEFGVGASGGLLEQFMLVWLRQFRQTSFSAYDWKSTLRSENSGAIQLYCCAPSGEWGSNYPGTTGAEQPPFACGIVAGTGTGAISVTDRALGTIINHGAASGELYYHATMARDWTEDTGTDDASFHLVCILENRSGGSITVEELGIQVSGIASAPALTYLYCIQRDVLGGSAFSIANDGFRLIDYTFSLSV